MEAMLALLLFLALARGFGSAAEACKLPSSVGEIGAGILVAWLATSYGGDLPFLSGLVHSEALSITAKVAVFCLVLHAGIEMEPSQIAHYSGKALFIALGGVIVPLIGGAVLAWYLLEGSNQRELQSLVTGVVLSITALPVVVKILSEANMLRSPAGEIIIAAALFDDIIGLVLLAILLAVVQTGELPAPPELGFLALKIGGFFLLTVLLGAHIYPHVQRGLKTLQATAMEFTALTMTALAYGWLAEFLSLHWVIGAFMAGLFFEKSRVGIRSYTQMKATIATVIQAFLAPLFFLSIGLYVDFQATTTMPLLLVALVSFAFFSKIVGAGGAAKLLSLSNRDAGIIGIGMSARGVIELVILDIVYAAGVFSGTGTQGMIGASLLSSLILVSILTTALAPVLLQFILFNKKQREI